MNHDLYFVQLGDVQLTYVKQDVKEKPRVNGGRLMFVWGGNVTEFAAGHWVFYTQCIDGECPQLLKTSETPK